MKKQTFVIVALFGLILNFQACIGPEASTVVSQVSVPSRAGGPDETEGGHEHGNGGDDTRFAKAAWYADTARTVKYCVQISDGFPVSRDEVLTQVRSTLTAWNDLMALRKLYSMTVVSKVYSLENDCAQVDLRLLFGIEAPAHMKSKIGDVYRESFEYPSHWSRGFVWISANGANWAETFRLKGALLHLMGEVLGFDSVSGTILDPKWEQWIIAPRSPELENMLTRIEHARRLAAILTPLSGPVQISEKMKLELGLATTTGTEVIDVDYANLKLTIQGRSLRFVSLHMRELVRGDLHRVVYLNKNALYSWMRSLPMIVNTSDYTVVSVIQFLDLPGRPQMILELNGDQAVNLTSY